MMGPTELNVYLTTKCNARCKVCLRQHGVVEDAPDVDGALVGRVLNVFSTIRYATVAGFGEPTLSDQCGNVGRLLSKHCEAVALITNGIDLDQHADDLAVNGYDTIVVSLNGADVQERAEFGMGKGMRETILGIRKLIDAGQKTVVSFIVHKGNVHRVFAWLNLAHQLEVEGVDLVNLLPPYGLRAGDARAFWELVIKDDDDRELALLEHVQETHPFAEKVRAWPVPLDTQGLHRCQSPSRVVGVDGAGHLTVCRRIIPPLRNAGLIWMQDPYQCPAFAELRGGLERGGNSLHDSCKLCFGRGVDT